MIDSRIALGTGLVAIACLLAALGGLQGQTQITWNGPSAGGQWDLSNANWNTSQPDPWNTINGATNAAVFNTANLSLSIGGTVDTAGLTFQQAATISGGNITLRGNAPIISGAGVIGSVLLGTSGLTKTGEGTLTLTGTNLYTGTTRVTGGTLAVAGDAGLGSAPLLATPSSIVLDGGILSTSGTWTLNANRGIAVGPSSGEGSGTIDVSSGVLTYNGIIASNGVSSTGSFIKTGSGTLVLGGNNTYTGNTLLNAGTIKLANASALPSGTGKGDLTANGTLDLNGYSASINGLFGTGTITSGAAGAAILAVGSNNRSGNFSGTISDGAGTLTLSKTGTGTLALSGNNSFTGGVTINAGTLQIASVGALNSATPNSVTFGANAPSTTRLQLNGYSITIGALATNPSPGTVAVENAGASAATLTVSQSSNTTFAGTLRDGSGGGALSLVKAGSGTLTLAGTNTYNGTTTISAGKLAVSGGAALSDTGSVILANTAGAMLQLNSSEAIGALSGGGASGGNIALQSYTLTVGGANSDTIYGGTISGTGNLVKNGSGSLTLSRANDFSGSTAIRNGRITLGADNALPSTTVLTLGDGTSNTSGILALAGYNQTLAGLATAGSGSGNRIVNGSATARTLTINTSSNYAFSGSLGGAGTNEDNFSLVKAGSGTLTLSGNNTYTGTTAINGGTLSLGNLTANLGSGSSAVSLDTGRLNYTGASASFTRGFSVSSNGGQVDVATAGQTLTLSSGGVTIAGTGTFVVGGAGNAVISSNIVGSSGGILTKTGTGTLTLSGSNAYTGATNIKDGTVLLGTNGGINSAATVTLGDSAANTSGTLRLNGYSQTVSSLAVAGTGTGNRVAGGSATLSLLTINNAGASSFSGILGGTGTNDNNLSLTKTGSGTLTLSGSNTYAGGTTISQGTLAVSSSSNLGNTGGLLGIGNGTLQATSSFTSSRSISLDNAASAILVDNGVTLTDSGNISGSGALNLTGNGTLLVSGSGNTYSGGTNIRNGTLTLGRADTLPAGTVVTLGNGTSSGKLALNGYSQTISGLATSGTGTANRIVNGKVTSATLTVNNTSDFTFSGILGGNGTNENTFGLTKTGAGTLTLSGSNTYTGTTRVAGGTLATQGGSSISDTGAVQLDNTAGATLRLGANETIGSLAGGGSAGGNVVLQSYTLTTGGSGASTSFNGSLSGTGGLVKTGAGTFTLGGTNTYSGNTTVSAGTLKIGNAAALAYGSAGGNLSLTGSLDLNGYSITLNGLSGAGSINSTAAGDIVLSVGANDQTSSFSGIISNGAATSLGLNKVGTGTLTLSGNNIYSGDTTISAGTLKLNGTTTLPSGAGKGNVTVAGGATLDMSNRSQGINGLSGNGLVTTSSASSITLTAGLGNATSEFGGNLQNGNGTLALTKNGTGTLTLSGNNSFTGTTTVNAGTLALSGGQALADSGAVVMANTAGGGLLLNASETVGSLAGGGTTGGNLNLQSFTLTTGGANTNTTYNGTISGSGNLVKTGTGTFTLGTNSTYTGTTSILGGTLSIRYDTNLGIAPASAAASQLTINGGTLQTTASLTLNSTRGIAIGPNSGSGNGTFDIVSSAGAILTTTYNGTIANSGSGNGTLVKTGLGNLALGGNNTYTGGTVVAAGLLSATSTLAGTPFGADVSGNNIAVNAGANLGLSSILNKGANQTITVASDGSGRGGIGFSNAQLTQAQLSALFTNNTGSFGGVLGIDSGITYASALNLSTFGSGDNLGKWFLGSASSGTYSNATLTAGANGTYRLGGGGGNLTVSASNVLTGNNGLLVGFSGTNGNGIVTLSNSQNFTGNTTVTGGAILAVGGDNRLGGGSGAGNIVIDGGSLRTTATFTLNSARGISLGSSSDAGTGTIDVSSGTTLTYGGIIADNGAGGDSLAKAGAGTLVLTSTSNNTFTGGVNIGAGTLNFAAIGNLGLGGPITFSGGTLQYAAGNSADITSRDVATTTSATIDTNGNDVAFANAISGAGSFTKTGAGTLALNAANSYLGNTTISAGTVKLGNAAAIPGTNSSSTTTINGILDLNGLSPTLNLLRSTGTNGTITNSNSTASTLTVNTSGSSSAGTYGGVINDGAGTIRFVKTGANTLNLTGTASTYSGGTLVSAGSLSISNDRALGAVPLSPTPGSITIAGGATLASSATMAIEANRGIAISGSGAASLMPAAGTTLTYNGVIANEEGSSGGLTKSNTTGILVLGGANTYAGNTTISGGTLRVANAAALPSGSGKGNVSLSGTLDLNGYSVIVNGLSGSGNVTTGISGPAAIAVGGNDTSSSFAGVISDGSGTVSLGKIGAGTLTLSGTNTYTGNTTITGGALAISSDSNLGAAPSSPVSGSIVIDGGTLRTTANMTLDANRGMVVGPANAALDLGAATTLTYSGTIEGTGGLTKSNTAGSTLILGGANTYSGDTSILGGTLQLANAGAIPSGTGKGNLYLASGSALDLNNLSPAVNGLTGSGNITNSGTGNTVFSAGGNDQTSSFGGIIQDGNGLVSFNKIGAGTLTLAGANTFSGNTTISAGTLRAGNSTALASGTGKGNLSVGTLGTLDLNGYSLVINGLSGNGAITNSAGAPATLTAGANDQTSTFSGKIADGAAALGLTKTGTGTLTLSGNNTFSGATTISAGTLAMGSATGLSAASSLSINPAGTLDVNGFSVSLDALSGSGTINNNGASPATLTAGASGGTSSFSGVIADGTSSLSLTKSGAGTLTLTGVNTYSGTTSISAGTISVANLSPGSSSLGSSSSQIILGSAATKGTLSYTANADLSYTRGFVVNAGGGEMDITSAGKTLTIETGAIAAAGTFSVGGAGSAIVSSAISGAGGFTKANSGSLVLSGTNSYSGDTTILAGTLQVTNASAIPSGTGKGNVIVAGAGILDVNNLSLTINGLSGSGTVTNSQGSPVTLTVGGNDAGGNFAGTIEDGAGTLSLEKIGNGTLTLGGTNTYSGNTSILAGTLQYGAAGAIPSGTSKGDVFVAAAGTIDLNDFDAALNGLSGAGLVTNSFGASNLAVGANDQTSIFSGDIRDGGGTIGLTKTGSGTLTLSGNNTFSGSTLIAQGTLSMGSDTGLSAASSLTVGNAGALDLNGHKIAIDGLSGEGSITNNSATAVTLTVGASGGTGTFNGTIDDGTGVIGLVKSGPGTVTLTHVNTYSGGTTVTGGLLGITSSSALGKTPASPQPGNIVLDGGGISAVNTFELDANRGIAVGPASGSGNGTLDVALNQTLTYNGIIADNSAGAGGLAKTGLGTLTLGGTNTYSGDTSVEAGSLQVASTGAIPFGLGKGDLNLSSNSTLDLNNFSITINGLNGTGTVSNTKSGNATLGIGANDADSEFAGILENGNGITSLEKVGNGTLTLTGTGSTYTGQTLIAEGRLALDQNAALGGSTYIAISAGAILSAIETFTLDASREIGVGSPGEGIIEVAGDKTLTYAGTISDNGGQGGFTKTGNGTLILSGNSTFTGTTTVGAGTLAVLGSLASSSGITVNTGATLTGTGTTGAMEVESDGTISPGNGGIGSLGVAGHLGLSGIANFELGTPGSSHYSPGTSDRIAVEGSVTFGGTLNLIDNAGKGGLGSLGAGSYKLVTYTTTSSGSFSEVTGLPSNYHEVLHDVAADKALYIDLYNYAIAAVTPSLDFGRIHAGGDFGSRAVTVTNTAPSGNFTESLASTFGNATAGVTASGSISNLGGNSSNSSAMTVGITDNSAGTKSGSVAVDFTSVAVTGSGLGNTQLSPQSVEVSGFAYTGQGTWDSAGGGSWGNNADDYGRWELAGGVPGLDGTLSANDTATFGDAIAGDATIDLDGATPSLHSITFNSAHSYTLARGTGGSLTLAGSGAAISSSGNHTISAPLSLATDVSVSVAGTTDTLLVAGSGISGNFGIAKTGEGTLRIAAQNTYTGGTTVQSGVLAIAGTGSVLGDTIIQGGSTITGTGNAGSLLIEASAFLDPGERVGTLYATAAELIAGGTYIVDISAANGELSSASDRLAVSGTLDLSGLSSSNQFHLDIYSRPDGGQVGDLSGFVPGQPYSWIIGSFADLTLSGGVSRDSLTSLFDLDVAQFQGGSTSVSGWRVYATGTGGAGDLILEVVPEPAAVSLALFGLAAGLAVVTRKRKRA